MDAKTSKPENYLAKPGSASEAELEVAKAFAEIAESSTSGDARAAISKLTILKVKEVDVPETGKKALVIVVPYVAFKSHVKPHQQRCITEIEKKTKRHAVLIAHRQMLPPGVAPKGTKVRPMSRSLTAVQKALVEDIVGPTEIVGRRTKITQDGKKLYKIFLDPKDRAKENVEEKLPAYAAIYKSLTNKNALFDFAEYVL